MSDQADNKPFSVDREKVTPFLIRVFAHRAPHKRDSEFRDPTNLPKEGQIHIHTWMDATLSELTALLGKVLPQFRNPRFEAELSFALVYPDRKGRMQVKQSDGKVTYSSGRSDKNADDENAMKTLKDLGFQIGDFLDVAITEKGSSRNGMRGGLRSRPGQQDNYGPPMRRDNDDYGPRQGFRERRGGYRGRRGRGRFSNRRGRGGYRRR